MTVHSRIECNDKVEQEFANAHVPFFRFSCQETEVYTLSKVRAKGPDADRSVGGTALTFKDREHMNFCEPNVCHPQNHICLDISLALSLNKL